MRAMYVVLLLGVVSVGARPLVAQTGAVSCPPGQHMQQGVETASCSPAPAASMAGPPEPVYQDRWGAIAIDGAKNAVGFATSKLNEQSATEAAVIDCRAKRGEQCEVKLTYHNACAALVTSGKDYRANTAGTIDLAVRNGMAACSRQSKPCLVSYSACSRAVQIQ